MRRRAVSIDSLEDHPNLGEVLGVLSQVPHITDQDVTRLAAAWHNTAYLAEARAKALTPESPLVVEVLAAFDAVQSLFSEDLDGEADYITVDPKLTTVALKAVRDAIAGAYARPTLSRGEHMVLLRAWREVFPVQAFEEPDLGPRAEDVKALLATMPLVSSRCHDAQGADLYDTLLRTAWTFDDDMRRVARDESWQAAVLTDRRRMWAFLRRTVTEGLGRHCTICGPRMITEDDAQVLALYADAACALLVADAVDETLTDVLTLPLQRLIPAPRTSPEA